MARFDDLELEEVKRRTDLAALIRSRGVELKGGEAGNLVGRCPFHDDATPSLVVTPAKGLWRCMSPACAATGNAIQFIMKKDGLSFRHAVELLRAPSAAAFTASPKTVRALPPPVALDADDKTLLRQVLDYYAERLNDEAAGAPARAYLKKRGLGSPEAITAHRIGFADRTLGLRLPLKNRKDGAEIRARLERLGVYRESGHEHFNGCVVFPLLDSSGEILGLYGRKIIENQTPGLPKHLYLPGPRRGWWNPAALNSPEVILCEAVLDALSFWENDHRNVTTAYGVEGFSDDMLDAFVAAKVATVFIAFDRDEGGEIGAAKVGARLMARGIECRRVLFPHGQDANEYARKTSPANKALGVLLNAAQWMGRGKGEVCSHVAPAPSSLAALVAKEVALPTPASEATAPVLPTPPPEAAKEKSPVPTLAPRGEHWFLELDGREWRVGGMDNLKGADALKLAVRLRVGEAFHLDTLDLARDLDRRRFVERAAEETRLHADLLKRDVGRLLLAVETTVAARSAQAAQVAAEGAGAAVVLTPEEKAEALAWLQAPALVARLRDAFRRAGVVGEENNSLLGYLCCVSRLLDKPLAAILQSPSAAGKTTVMDGILAFFPEECRVKYSAMTGQSLFYMGDFDLRHKILAIVEEAGAEKASYALKLLQSEQELRIASTGKNPQTGRMETQEYHVEGPVMIMLTTTAIDLDEELQNRCLTLSVDDSPEQTARIHAVQRERRTLAGLVAKAERADLLRLMKNVQRLLEPLEVLNDYAPRLTFPTGQARNRRDHEKYLTLIDSIALMHQHQRPRRTRQVAGGIGGKKIDYIEATLEDIALANQLAPEVLGRSLDELPPQTRRLLDHVRAFVRAKQAEPGQSAKLAATFSRRELREFCGWSLTQVRLHLDRLVELECLELRHGRLGGSFVYELMIDADAPEHVAHIRLIDVETLRAACNYDAGVAGFGPGVAGQTGAVAEGGGMLLPPPKPAASQRRNAPPSPEGGGLGGNAHQDGGAGAAA
jgi:DNA primase catalytic core